MHEFSAISNDVVKEYEEKVDFDDKVKRSRIVYLCSFWSKICFLVTVLLILIFREIIFMFAEDRVLSVIALLYSENNRTKNQKIVRD